MLLNRLEEKGGKYGDYDTHEGLWESAEESSHSLIARLAIEHIVHEGRGLDVTPRLIHKLKSYQDKESAKLLETILNEEVHHVSSAVKWFNYLFDHGKLTNLDPVIIANQQQNVNDNNNNINNDKDINIENNNEKKEYEKRIQLFHDIVRIHFRGKLKKPFNHEFRSRAGMSEDWYVPLSN